MNGAPSYAHELSGILLFRYTNFRWYLSLPGNLQSSAGDFYMSSPLPESEKPPRTGWMSSTRGYSAGVPTVVDLSEPGQDGEIDQDAEIANEPNGAGGNGVESEDSDDGDGDSDDHEDYEEEEPRDVDNWWEDDDDY